MNQGCYLTPEHLSQSFLLHDLGAMMDSMSGWPKSSSERCEDSLGYTQGGGGTRPGVLGVLKTTWVFLFSLPHWSLIPMGRGEGKPAPSEPDPCLLFLALFLISFPKSQNSSSSSHEVETSLLSYLHSALLYDSINDCSTFLSFDFFWCAKKTPVLAVLRKPFLSLWNV